MKYLVTGCAGFIGSNIIDDLIADGHDVIGIDSFSPYYDQAVKRENIVDAKHSSSFQLIEGDINRLDLGNIVSKVDYIIHEAGQPGIRSSWGPSFRDYVENNVMATQQLLEACKQSTVKKVVIASSSSVYGTATTKPLTESDPTKPESPYGVTKLAVEKLSLAYHLNFVIPVVLLRYFTVYGPRQRPDMAMRKFIDAIVSSKKIAVYGDGSQQRDFTYVDDACAGTINAAEKAEAGSILNIGSGRTVSLMDVIRTIEAVAGTSFDIAFEPHQKGDVKNTMADITKARNMIGYNPASDLRKGIEKEYLWVKNRTK